MNRIGKLLQALRGPLPPVSSEAQAGAVSGQPAGVGPPAVFRPPDDLSPAQPHVALSTVPYMKAAGWGMIALITLLCWVGWKGYEMPFVEERYQHTDSTGYRPAPEQHFLVGSIPRSLGGRPMVLPHPALPDGPADVIPPEAAALTNPLQIGPAVIYRGRDLYGINCAMCHGNSGHGDGPVGQSYTPRPPDLLGPRVEALSEGGLFYSITNGILSTPIPESRKYIPRQWHAFREELSDAARWAIVTYVRELETDHASTR